MLKTTLITCLASIATAIPTLTPRTWCLGPKDGHKLASRYADLISAFTADKAAVLLADSFTETSDSLNAVVGKPLGAITYASRAEFIAGQARLPSAGMDVVAVDAVTCDTVVLRWRQRFVGAPVTGITVLRAVIEGDDWRVAGVETEFNSLVYATELGRAGGM